MERGAASVDIAVRSSPPITSREIAGIPVQLLGMFFKPFPARFVDWLGSVPPADFSFELAYGALLGSVESDDPDAGGLAALCGAAAHVATRIREECEE